MILEELRVDIAKIIPEFLVSADEFGEPPFSLSDLADCIIMDAIKPIFEKTLKTVPSSIRLKERLSKEELGDDFQQEYDRERMAFSRQINYAENSRKLWYDYLMSTRGAAPPELLPPALNTMREKISGRHLNAMQLDEIENLKSLRILKYINSGALVSSKKVSIDKFEELFEEYSSYVKYLGTTVSDDASLVYNSFTLYNLRWHFPLELYYKIVCELESISDSDPVLAVAILSTHYTINTGEVILHTDNRFILHRSDLVPLALESKRVRWVKEKIERYLYAKWRILKRLDIDNIPFPDYISKTTNIHDWAEFIRLHYPILQDITDFQWTTKRIRSFRKLLREILQANEIDSKLSTSLRDK